MRVVIYGKDGCGNCVDAENKLQRMKVAYEKVDFGKAARCELEDPRSKDEKREAGVVWALGNAFFPVFVCDGVGMSYPEAMKYIKARRREKE